MSTHTNSPDSTPIEPLHNPLLAAQVVVPQAPIGNSSISNKAPSMGAKALLARKLRKNRNPAFISPTDKILTPCTQKLNAARKKRFDKKHLNKPPNPVQLFAQTKKCKLSEDGQVSEQEEVLKENKVEVDDANPF